MSYNMLYVNVSICTFFWNGAVGYFVILQSVTHPYWFFVCLTPPWTPSGVVEVTAAIAAWSSVSIEADSKRLCCSVFDSALEFSSVQSLGSVWLFPTPWTAARQASLSITNSRSLLKLMSIESMIPSNHLSHPLSPCSPPALNLCLYQGLFQWVTSLHQVTKILEFYLQHESFQWIFRTDFL